MRVFLSELSHIYAAPGGAAHPALRVRTALRVRELSLGDRSHVCLVGSSGSGKTTLLNVLAGVLVPSAGQVRLDDSDLFSLSEPERDRFRARHIGCIFQTLNLLQGLSALENLTLAQHFAGIAAAQARPRARELLQQLGLAERADARPSELSLGEQQRVAIARAVSKRPSLVLADEPTASLDDDNAHAAIELLIDACKDSTLIVASHDSRLIERFADVRPLAALA